MKITKIILIRIGLISTIAVLFSFCSRHFNENGLKQIIKEKTGIELKGKINIKKYENTGAAISDFAETYQIELIPEDFSKVIEQIQNEGRKNSWEKIERGYQLTIPKKTSKDTIFIFFIDEKNKSLKVQIIEE